MKFSRDLFRPRRSLCRASAFEPRSSRIVNPDGSVIFEAKDVMVPAGWSQVAVDVLAQKYCRKAGVPKATARVAEEGVPAGSSARSPTDRRWRRCRATSSSGPSATRARSSTGWRAAGRIGAGSTATSIPKTTRRSTTTRCARCSRARSARRTHRNGSIPDCIGRTASPVRRKVIVSSIAADGDCEGVARYVLSPSGLRVLTSSGSTTIS